MEINKFYQGHALDVLRTFPDGCIDSVVTSPPYWGLRNYGTNPQVWGGDANCQHEWAKIIKPPNGGKNNPERPPLVNANKAMDKMDVRGKGAESDFCPKCGAWLGELGLEPTLQMFMDNLMLIFDEIHRVLKDTGTLWVNLGDCYSGSGGMGSKYTNLQKRGMIMLKDFNRSNMDIPKKSLCLIPQRFAINMVDRGWLCRNEIIWYKPNAMPESVKDRFTNDYEPIYFFTKAQDYYFEQQLEESYWANHDPRAKNEDRNIAENGKIATGTYKMQGVNYRKDGKRNMRCVWELNTKGSTENHFATYPQRLIKTPILAGCPVDGVVLDPFMGTGTTAVVSRKLDRRFIGIELNPESIDISESMMRKEFGLFL